MWRADEMKSMPPIGRRANQLLILRWHSLTQAGFWDETIISIIIHQYKPQKIMTVKLRQTIGGAYSLVLGGESGF